MLLGFWDRLKKRVKFSTHATKFLKKVMGYGCWLSRLRGETLPRVVFNYLISNEKWN